MKDSFGKTDNLFIAFVFCAISYLLALSVSVITGYAFRYLQPLIMIFIADVAATLIITVISTIFKNASFYDPYWSLAPTVIAIYWLLKSEAQNVGIIRQIVVFFLVLLWSIRLTYNWIRQWQGLNHEDWRYANLRKKMGRLFWLTNLIGIELMPTILVFLGSLSLYPALSSGNNNFGLLDIIAVVITAGAIIIEALADQQLYKFKARNRTEQVMSTGLWAYSRHPNYFGEIIFWWGLYLFALASGFSFWWTIVGPISITILFIFLSIPLMEKRNLSRRPSYSKYKDSVSILIPWFPKKK